MGIFSETVEHLRNSGSYKLFAGEVQFPTTFVALSLTSLMLFGIYRLVRLKTRGADGVDGRVRRYPPGPRGLPLLGSLLDFRTDLFTKMKQYTETFGGIYRVKIGPTNIVVLNSGDLMKEAFDIKSHDFNNRPQAMMDSLNESKGIVLAQPGHIHRRNRNFLFTGFRLMKLGVPEFSNRLHPHIDNFKDNLLTSLGKPLPMIPIIHNFMFTLFADLILGEVPDTKSDRVNKLLEVLYKTLTPNPMLVLAGKIIPECVKSLLSDWVDMSDSMSMIKNFFKEHIEKHRELYTGSPDNLVDAFLYKEASTMQKLNKQVVDEEFNRDEDSIPKIDSLKPSSVLEEGADIEQHIPTMLVDVFQAGCTSIVALVQWMMLLLAQHPDIQSRIQREIAETVKESSERPSLLIRSNNFPVTRATILETLRLCPAAPLGAPHCAVRDTTLNGYDIKKDTIILSNILMAQRDPQQFEEPESFRPDRFLDSEGRLSTKDTIAFSLGPRTCPGKLLTVTVASCFVVDVLQDFTLRLPDNEKFDLAGKFGIVFNPKPFSLIAEKRDSLGPCHLKRC